jgi:hypothetical protein
MRESPQVSIPVRRGKAVISEVLQRQCWPSESLRRKVGIAAKIEDDNTKIRYPFDIERPRL